MLGKRFCRDMNTSLRNVRWSRTSRITLDHALSVLNGLHLKIPSAASEYRHQSGSYKAHSLRACKKNYHMACLTPPLLAKPAKGYSWVCIPCSLQRHQDVKEKKFLYTANGSAPKKDKSAGAKGKEKVVGNVSRPDVSYGDWPWRYFGYVTPLVSSSILINEVCIHALRIHLVRSFQGASTDSRSR